MPYHLATPPSIKKESYDSKKTGVAGFEPTHEGVKVPCLTAWLYPNKKGRMKGIEPSNAGATIRSVNHFATSAILIITGVAGIEPTPTVLETVVLPLNYTPKMEESGFEPLNPKERIYSPSRLATSLLLHMARDRVELPTHGASIRCSTN